MSVWGINRKWIRCCNITPEVQECLRELIALRSETDEPAEMCENCEGQLSAIDNAHDRGRCTSLPEMLEACLRRVGPSVVVTGTYFPAKGHHPMTKVTSVISHQTADVPDWSGMRSMDPEAAANALTGILARLEGTEKTCLRGGAAWLRC